MSRTMVTAARQTIFSHGQVFTATFCLPGFLLNPTHKHHSLESHQVRKVARLVIRLLPRLEYLSVAAVHCLTGRRHCHRVAVSGHGERTVESGRGVTIVPAISSTAGLGSGTNPVTAALRSHTVRPEWPIFTPPPSPPPFGLQWFSPLPPTERKRAANTRAWRACTT